MIARRIQVLTVEEAAALARVSAKTIYRAIWSGELKAGRAGSQWRLLESDVWAWLGVEAA